MTWQSIQIGDRKAKKRVRKESYQRIANMHCAYPAIYNSIMSNYERDLKIARKTTRQHPENWPRGPSAAERRNMMRYSLEGVE